MARWSTSDKIAAFGVAVAIILGVAALSSGDPVVPDEAVVIDETSHADLTPTLQQ
jgi:hypothetical protein